MSSENETESAPEVVIAYRVNKTSQSEVNKKFLVEFKNNLQTEWRNCVKCDALVKAPTMGTSGMHKHLLTCCKAPSKRPLQHGQSTLKYQKISKQRLFSSCRYSKNYLQNRMTAENHARNVFITRNTQFLSHSV